MDFRVEITDPAIDDLSEIVSYIAQDNPDAASVLGVPVAKRQSFAGKQFWLLAPGGVIICWTRHSVSREHRSKAVHTGTFETFAS